MLIDECQRITEKIFPPSETSKIIGMVDYLGLDLEHILSLFTDCLLYTSSGENLETLIEEYSEDTTGGDYCFTAGQLLEEFEKDVYKRQD